VGDSSTDKGGILISSLCSTGVRIASVSSKEWSRGVTHISGGRKGASGRQMQGCAHVDIDEKSVPWFKRSSFQAFKR